MEFDLYLNGVIQDQVDKVAHPSDRGKAVVSMAIENTRSEASDLVLIEARPKKGDGVGRVEITGMRVLPNQPQAKPSP